MKANEVAGEKTSFCPESLAGCSPFAKVRCNSYYPLVPVSTSLPPRRLGPDLATDVGVHVVRVRRRTCTREHARCRDERKRERKREREKERKEGKEKERMDGIRKTCERDPSFSLARGWGRPFSRVLNIFMMAAGAGGAAWKWRVGGGCRDGGANGGTGGGGRGGGWIGWDGVAGWKRVGKRNEVPEAG